MRHPDPLEKLECWYEHSLANTQKLHQGGVNLAFGTDAPFAFGNFHHSLMNEARALRCAGVPHEAILRMGPWDQPPPWASATTSAGSNPA